MPLEDKTSQASTRIGCGAISGIAPVVERHPCTDSDVFHRGELYFHLPLVAEPSLVPMQLMDAEVLRFNTRREADPVRNPPPIMGATLRLSNGVLVFLPASNVSSDFNVDIRERLAEGMVSRAAEAAIVTVAGCCD